MGSKPRYTEWLMVSRLANQALLQEDVSGSGCIDPCFLDLCTTCRWVVKFTLLPLYCRGKSPVPVGREAGWAVSFWCFILLWISCTFFNYSFDLFHPASSFISKLPRYWNGFHMRPQEETVERKLWPVVEYWVTQDHTQFPQHINGVVIYHMKK
jgi:hypothetical protein